MQRKYALIKASETRHEELLTDDAEYLIVAFGSAARVSRKAIESAREENIRVGMFRPITVWPFPEKELEAAAKGKKGILVVEINAGQMIYDVRLAVGKTLPIEHCGRMGGIIPEPTEVVDALKSLISRG